MLKIYLAGPDVFRADSIEYGELLKRVCAKHGVEGCFPRDNKVDLITRKGVQRFIKLT